jgi:hypothetical protein
MGICSAFMFLGRKGEGKERRREGKEKGRKGEGEAYPLYDKLIALSTT